MANPVTDAPEEPEPARYTPSGMDEFSAETTWNPGEERDG